MGLAPGEITLLLVKARNGDREAESALLPLLYDEPQSLARCYARHERPDHIFQPTAAVHERVSEADRTTGSWVAELRPWLFRELNR